LVILWTLGGLAVLSDGRSDEALGVLSECVAKWEVVSPVRRSLHERAHKMTALRYEKNGPSENDSMRGALQRFGELVDAWKDRRAGDAASGPSVDC
jgi:hypothetical protein